jgi:hypothetical protein
MTTLYDISPDQFDKKMLGISSEKMSFAAKVIAFGLVSWHQWAKEHGLPMWGELRQLPLGFLVTSSGSSRSSVQRALRELVQCMMVEYDTRSEKRGEEMSRTYAYARLTDRFWNVTPLVPKMRNRGRNQKNFIPCVTCGGETYGTGREERVCFECGEVHLYYKGKGKIE